MKGGIKKSDQKIDPGGLPPVTSLNDNTFLF